MTRRSVSKALDDHDVTEALTVTQVALVAIAAFVLLRILRSLRR